MASIRKRIAKGCVNEAFQVQIRRAGIRSFTITFNTRREAEKWVAENEERYIRNPSEYDELREIENRRELLRKREFDRVSGTS